MCCCSNLVLRTKERFGLVIIEVDSLFGFVGVGGNGKKTGVFLGAEARSGEGVVAGEVEGEV